MSETVPNIPIPPILSEDTIPQRPYSRRRIRTGLMITLVGLLIFLVGARPSIFGLDRSPVIGFVQIAVFLIGLALICIGGYLSMMALWKKQQPSIAADLGLRLVCTGYVVAVFAGMADIFGLGSHPLPGLPFFGQWQARGVEVGQAIIAIGFLMLIPFKKPDDTRPASK
ncbi:hypothetical protein LARV_03198 [Longilinea arvoryzae]|uniref:Uncharacterized protein n=1 Tax=Longilinea arvoryzae TaxID=360412 RepID=A0A0S7BJT4_9CHLR|nr:hypothetical protein [Longilinea arvoryzae]GAP15412.1 hypothetical protein LARV_03198 [Longilinea arvoryzae]